MPSVDIIIEKIVASIRQKGQVLVFGVGGNAANAIHFSAELSGKYEKWETPLPCICLSENPSVITAITNDFGWEYVFSRQIKALGRYKDVVLAFSISTSGAYLVNAINQALEQGCEFLLICGRNTLEIHDDKLTVLELGSSNTPRVQETQLKMIHQICEGVKAEFP